MEKLLYEDPTGQYYLLDYSPSHSEMVIRRINKTDQYNIFNIDLFFKAVKNINLATRLDGIKIYKAPRPSKNALMEDQPKRTEIYKVVDSTGNFGFIDATVFAVFHNKLDILTTSLGDFTWSRENKEVFSTVIH